VCIAVGSPSMAFMVGPCPLRSESQKSIDVLTRRNEHRVVLDLHVDATSIGVGGDLVGLVAGHDEVEKSSGIRSCTPLVGLLSGVRATEEVVVALRQSQLAHGARALNGSEHQRL